MLYLIAATVNEQEYLIIEPNFSVISFTDLQTAKKQFQHFYHIITNAPKHTIPFNQAVKLLVTTQPSILKVNTRLSKLGQTILEASTKGATMRSFMPIILRPHILLPLEKGYLTQHEVLNIRKDIEATPCVGADGEITYQRFNTDPTVSNEQRVTEFRQQQGLN